MVNIDTVETQVALRELFSKVEDPDTITIKIWRRTWKIKKSK